MGNDRIEQRIIMLAMIAASISAYMGYTVLLILGLYKIFKSKPLGMNFICKKNGLLCSIIVYLFFQLIQTQYTFYGLQAFTLIILQIVAYITIRDNFKTQEEYGDLINILVLGSIMISVIGIVQYFYLDPSVVPKSWIDKTVYNIQIRVYSTMYNPNVLGAYLVSMICITVTAIEEMRNRLFHVISLCLCSICLIFTYSRAALLALAVATVVLTALKKNKRYIIYGMIILILALMIDGSNYTQRMSPELASKDSSIGYRLEIYKAAMNIIQDHALFGTGLNTMQVYIDQYSTQIKAPVFHGHNLFLHTLAETGFIGFSLLLVMLGKAIKNAIEMVIYSQNKGIKTIGISMSMFYMTLLIQGITDAVVFAPQYAIFVWTMMAISDGIWMKLEKENRQHRWWRYEG
ncbi:O-antigen ligase [Anaerosolibacter carboniphilus]|uniref:O-antigen ligase n=1 Tax=Anaerosolibacter carboniphilus TaxID=1417629 RepID=A0A841L1M5_9FIRM|nr:O-antigen ligase family protein [Anaerosolibacter carboniphilus]MBB6216265.1 O-antigen ligase [Anaerosolibacter carboniphilus]